MAKIEIPDQLIEVGYESGHEGNDYRTRRYRYRGYIRVCTEDVWYGPWHTEGDYEDERAAYFMGAEECAEDDARKHLIGVFRTLLANTAPTED